MPSGPTIKKQTILEIATEIGVIRGNEFDLSGLAYQVDSTGYYIHASKDQLPSIFEHNRQCLLFHCRELSYSNYLQPVLIRDSKLPENLAFIPTLEAYLVIATTKAYQRNN